MFEQTFKNIDDILHKDAGCGSELDYVEQTSWVLFLKYLEDLERDKQTAAQLSGKTYQSIIEEQYKWHVWAVPKTTDGKIDHHKALGGDDLKDFVDHKLFPYLKKFKVDATLFLQHFIKILKAGGKGGIIIKNTFLSNTDNASVSLRKLLLANIDQTTFDLSVKNPSRNGEVQHRDPQDIMAEIAKLDAESADVLAKIRGLL